MRRLLRIGLLLLCVVLAAAGILLLVAYRAIQHAPDFYREALLAESAEQKKAADRMLQQATTLHNSVRHEGQWHAEFTADEINGWLATDLARNQPQSLPDGFRDPRVKIDPDGITLACQVERRGLHAVVSLNFDVYLDAPGVLAVRIRRARAGAVPWPLGQVLEAISQAARRANLRIQWRQSGNDPVALISIPSADGSNARIIRVDKIQLVEGAIQIAGATERGKP